MRREAQYKQLPVPNYLKRWINIKKVFPVHLYDSKAPVHNVKFEKDVQKPPVGGMPHMLEICGLELKGKHHSGIDDAKNIANIVVDLLEKGFVFTQGMVHSHPFSV